MITVQEHTGFKQVENYGFAEWLKEVQEVIQDGYEFDFESNANYPLQIGTVYTAVMKPREAKVALSDTVQPVVASIANDLTESMVQPKVDGRKRK